MSLSQYESKMSVAVSVMVLCLGISHWASGQTDIRYWQGQQQ